MGFPIGKQNKGSNWENNNPLQRWALSVSAAKGDPDPRKRKQKLQTVSEVM